MVLRHQVYILQRQLQARVRYRPSDRAILARAQPSAPSIPVAVLPGHPRDRAAVAPGSGQAQVAVLEKTARSWPTSDE